MVFKLFFFLECFNNQEIKAISLITTEPYSLFHVHPKPASLDIILGRFLLPRIYLYRYLDAYKSWIEQIFQPGTKTFFLQIFVFLDLL